jgi:Type II secretory pathway, component PulF
MSSVAKLRLSSKDRLTLLSDLGTMLTAGIPILEAVDALEQDSKGNFQRVLRRLRRGLNNGEPLSVVMTRMPDAFDAISVNLIRAAEAGGTLEETLRDIVASTKKEIAFNSTIRTATIYPLFVMTVFLGIVVLMLTFVIPRISKVFSNLRVNMPPVTKVSIAASNFFLQYWYIVIP